MPTRLQDLNEQIAEKSKQLHAIFEAAGPDVDLGKVTTLEGDTAAKAAEIKRRNDELTALGKERDGLAELEAIGKKAGDLNAHFNLPAHRVPQPDGRDGGAASDGRGPRAGEDGADYVKGLLLASTQYAAFRKDARGTVELVIPTRDFKSLISLTVVSAQAMRRPEPVTMGVEERTVADLMLESRTSSNMIEYYEETTFTNNAAAVAEGTTKPETDIAYTLRQEPVRKIATWIPATKEALDDVPWLASQISGRLTFAVKRAEEAQILNGNGTAPNLRGILNRSGIQTQAKGTDPTPDAIFKAMQKVRGSAGQGFAEPTAVVLHPDDWTDIRLLRTADGIYIWGNPSDAGPERIWGKEVRQTTAEPSGTGLVGAFRPYSQVVRREDVVVTVSTEHSTFFTDNKVAILAEERIALEVDRPSAFATVTGI